MGFRGLLSSGDQPAGTPGAAAPQPARRAHRSAGTGTRDRDGHQAQPAQRHPVPPRELQPGSLLQSNGQLPSLTRLREGGLGLFAAAEGFAAHLPLPTHSRSHSLPWLWPRLRPQGGVRPQEGGSAPRTTPRPRPDGAQHGLSRGGGGGGGGVSGSRCRQQPRRSRVPPQSAHPGPRQGRFPPASRVGRHSGRTHLGTAAGRSPAPRSPRAPRAGGPAARASPRCRRKPRRCRRGPGPRPPASPPASPPGRPRPAPDPRPSSALRRSRRGKSAGCKRGRRGGG